ncbi:MAG: ATP-binding protein [Patescibacteria group bacterium]
MITSQLILTIAIHGISGFILLGAGLFVFLQNPNRFINQAFFLNFIFIAIYEAGMVLGPLMPTYELAYLVWFTNLLDVGIPVTTSAVILAAINKLKEWRWYLIGSTVIAVGIFITALVEPRWFLPQVTPKLYFPWYLDGGWLYLVMVVFFIFGALIPYIAMLRAYMSGYDRERIEYFLLMYAFGFGFGNLNFALVFNIPIDPLIGAPIGLGLIPLAYGVVAKNLLNIRVVFARAALFSAGIATLAALLTLLIFLNDLLVQTVPWVQFWTVPIFTSVVAFVVGRLFWSKLVENDRVKYEFITVATHKLRTPLTQISWGVRSLLDTNPTPDVRALAEHIQRSSNRLIELTNALFETTEETSQQYAYRKEHVGLTALTKEVLERMSSFIAAKKLTVNLHGDAEVTVTGDLRRLTSVIEVLMENAINYSPQGEVIQIITYQKGGKAYYSIHDHGIGVESEEQHRIFTRFYRTDAAKRADTEGVGLGLAMAKNIIKRHGGNMGVESEGTGKGSVFWFSLPHA